MDGVFFMIILWMYFQPKNEYSIELFTPIQVKIDVEGVVDFLKSCLDLRTNQKIIGRNTRNH